MVDSEVGWYWCGVAGGVPIVMKELLAAGMIHGDAMTCECRHPSVLSYVVPVLG